MAHYMMATKATHKLVGNVSRSEPNLCIIRREEEKTFIGRWVTGLVNLFEVRFKKRTTRELTNEEKKKYHGMEIAVSGSGRRIGKIFIE